MQLAIEIPDSPRARARFTPEDELLAYAENVGFEAAQRQKTLAVEANTCLCGKQLTFDTERIEQKLKPKKLRGTMHLPGCPAFKADAAKLAAKISAEEQEKLYRAGDLRDRLRLARERGSL